MKKYILIKFILLFICSSITLNAYSNSQFFLELKTDGYGFYYNPNFTKKIMKLRYELHKSHPLYLSLIDGQMSAEDFILVETKINKTIDKWYYISFGELTASGPEVYTIYFHNKPIANIKGNSIAIPGDGFIYIIAKQKNNVDIKKKYYLMNNKLKEFK